MTWTASATGGGHRLTASGSGNINDTVTLPAGSTITYIVTGTIDPAATGTPEQHRHGHARPAA